MDNIAKKIENLINDSISVKREIIKQQIPVIEKISQAVISAVEGGRKVLIFGNGGSAADSQHIAAELVGRFQKERKAVAAVALTTDTSVLTCLGNDYGFEAIFSRQIEAIADKGDIALGISTSGRSKNIINAFKKAKELGLVTIALTGKGGDVLSSICDISLIVPSSNTARIQEAHITIAHIICELTEESVSKVA